MCYVFRGRIKSLKNLNKTTQETTNSNAIYSNRYNNIFEFSVKKKLAGKQALMIQNHSQTCNEFRQRAFVFSLVIYVHFFAYFSQTHTPHKKNINI